jgi:FlaA1/EpsC-like NDP-sugar epimerase
MTLRKRITAFAILDSFIVFIAIYFSYFTFIPDINIYKLPMLFVTALALLFLHHFFAFIYKFYNKSWQYASIGEMIVIVKASTFSVLGAALVQNLIYHNRFVRILMITWMLHVILIAGSRFSVRIIRGGYMIQQQSLKKTLIIGAGSAGTMVVRQLQQNMNIDLKPVAFIDDDPAKLKLDIMGIPVVGNSSRIAEVVEKFQIDNIIIAIPSLNKKALNRIFEECLKSKAKTQILPMLEDLVTGKISVTHFRDVQVEDLLGRESVELDIDKISDYVCGKTVMVTGAGGSIGSEICRQIARFSPKKIVLVGHGENRIYEIDLELRRKFESEIIPVIGDIQDRKRIFEVMEEHKPDVVYHAAAHKHVPLMEYNPKEAVKNNIFGTKNVAEAADTFGVHTFVLISSDKAVNPTNIMGSTKRFAEMIIQQLAQKSKTKFVAVRFGNVLGSNGSVIPLFKRQIQLGGPVTVTHPEMERYFMTIPEASRLVIQSGALAKGGEIFVLDMGDPVKIVDLAHNLIRLSGYTMDDIEIKFTGIRPGEKMYEELLNKNEIHPEQIFPKIHIGKSTALDSEVLNELLEQLLNMSETELHDTLLKVANNQFTSPLSVAN